MERLADDAGRQIRYGGAPQARSEDVESLLTVAHEIADTEDILTRLNPLETRLPQPKRTPLMQRELRLHIARIQSFRALMRQREATIKATLAAIMARGGPSK
jgi:hypothetical protein